MSAVAKIDVDDVPDTDVDEAKPAPSVNSGKFEPGRSGNPKGRPRKVVKQQSPLGAALDTNVLMKDNKGTKEIKASEAIARRLVQKAMAGDIPAIKLIRVEKPDFLKEVLYREDAKFNRAAFYAHLAENMSFDALMEFRTALETWNQKRWAGENGDEGGS